MCEDDAAVGNVKKSMALVKNVVEGQVLVFVALDDEFSYCLQLLVDSATLPDTKRRKIYGGYIDVSSHCERRKKAENEFTAGAGKMGSFFDGDMRSLRSVLKERADKLLRLSGPFAHYCLL